MTKLIGGVLVIVLAGVALWVWQSKQNSPVGVGGQIVSPVTQEMPGQKKDGVIASIKEAMELGTAMQCSYAVGTDQSTQAQVVIEGEKFKTTTAMQDMTIYGLFDGEAQYTWTSKDKQGMKMTKDCMDQMTDAVKDMTKPTDATTPTKDMREELDLAKDVSCQPAVKTDWSLPKDIAFTDQCTMMQESMKMLDQMKDAMPAGIEMPTMPYMAQ